MRPGDRTFQIHFLGPVILGQERLDRDHGREQDVEFT